MYKVIICSTWIFFLFWRKIILKDYVKQKNLMKESLTVKSNVDHLFSQKTEGQAHKQRWELITSIGISRRFLLYVFKIPVCSYQHAWRGQNTCENCILNPLCFWEHIHARKSKHIQHWLSLAGKYQHRKNSSISSSFLRMLFAGTPTDFAKQIEETNLN